jgi:hypothetical protein
MLLFISLPHDRWKNEKPRQGGETDRCGVVIHPGVPLLGAGRAGGESAVPYWDLVPSLPCCDDPGGTRSGNFNTVRGNLLEQSKHIR